MEGGGAGRGWMQEIWIMCKILHARTHARTRARTHTHTHYAGRGAPVLCELQRVAGTARGPAVAAGATDPADARACARLGDFEFKLSL